MPHYSKLLSLLSVLKRDAKLILAITFIVLIWAGIYLATAFHPEYASDSRIWIKRAGQEALVNHSSDEFNQATISPVAQAGNVILTQMEVMKSAQISDELTAYVNKYYPNENPSRQRINVPQYLKLKNKIGTDIIEANFTWDNPRLAQEFLGVVVAKYQDIANNSTRELKKHRREFLDATVADLENELLDVSALIKSYKEEHGIVTIASAQDQWTKEMGDISSALATIRMQKAGAYNQLRDIRSQLGVRNAKSLASSVISFDNKALLQLQESLNKATTEYLDKKTIWSDDNPKLVALRDKVDYLQGQIIELNGAASGRNGLRINDPVKAEMAKNLVESQNSYMDYAAQEASLEGALQRLEQKAEVLPADEYELTRMESKRTVLEEAYRALKTQQIEARMSESQDFLNNISVIDKPSYNAKPLPPSRVQYLLFALFSGLSLGLTASFLKNKLNQQMISREDITSITHKPILGRIPWYAKRSDYLAKQDSMQLAYQNIVSNLQHRVIQSNCKTLVFASPEASPNRQSTYVLEIANMFASLNYKVALVDCHPNRNDLLLNRAVTGNIKTFDLSNALFAEDEAYPFERGVPTPATIPSFKNRSHQPKLLTGAGNLSVFCNTQSINEPFMFYSSAAYQKWFMHQLASNFDLVVADVPIGYQSPEFPVIAKQSDAVVLLLKHELEPDELKETVHQLESWDINLMGSIVRDNTHKLFA